MAHFFALRDESSGAFAIEVMSGVSMFLVGVYMDGAGAGFQTTAWCSPFPGNETASGSRMEFPLQDPASVAAGYGVVTGVATIAMGLVGNAPIMVGPGVTFAKAYACLRASLSPSNVAAANIVVGLALLPLAVLSRSVRVYDAMTEDFRLGLSAGIAALLITIALQMTILEWTRSSSSVGLFVPLAPGAGDSRYSGQGAVVLLSFVVATSAYTREKLRPLSVVLAVLTAAVLVEAIRAGLGWVPPSVALPQVPATAGVSFAQWGDSQCGGAVASYVGLLVVEKIFNVAATLGALVLLMVSHRIGYTRHTFLTTLNDSRKFSRILVVDSVANVVLAPWLGTALVTPWIESAAGIVLGARSGLAAVVAGSLFLATSPIATATSAVLGLQVSAGALVFACIFAVASLRYVEANEVMDMAPAYLVFFLVPVMGSIGFGASLAFVYGACVALMTGSVNAVISPRPLVLLVLSCMYVVLAVQQGTPVLMANPFAMPVGTIAAGMVIVLTVFAGIAVQNWSPCWLSKVRLVESGALPFQRTSRWTFQRTSRWNAGAP